MNPRRILLVANQSALAPPLREQVLHFMEAGPCSFTILVPSDDRGPVTWTEAESWASAEARMKEVVAVYRELGAEIEGRVGIYRPLEAVLDVLAENHFDDIVVSTLPLGVSAWLGLDLPHQVEKSVGRPVRHVIWEDCGDRVVGHRNCR